MELSDATEKIPGETGNRSRDLRTCILTHIKYDTGIAMPQYAQFPKQLHKEGAFLDKAVPLQAWSGPEGSRKLRFPNFMTTAQDGGKVVSLTHRPHLPSGNTPGTHFC